MSVHVLFFGQLAEIAGTGDLDIGEVTDTDTLVRQLNDRFPGLAGSKYLLAVDTKMITEKTVLGAGSTVALLPPFSGG